MGNINLVAEEKWILYGIIIIFIAAAIIHFLYDLTGKNTIVGFFSPVNESIWEHLKMVIIPIIFWWGIYYLFKNGIYNINGDRWFTGLLVSLVTSLIIIPLLYYFYTEAFGIKNLFIDILITFLSILFGQLLGLHIYKNYNGIDANIAIIIITLIVIVFIIFTVYTPRLPIFKDGVTKTYGMLSKK